ncbi:AAA+ superfamily predicted ATPase [Paraburkholderia sp. JPY158]|uniref:AAA+ superfamily predicted ATPase n=1 Tax=Paraburkholderia atlantica TaxID=2654982 RepID=A0A7W8VAR0_PARAM|nr:AAA family ATPase [Paraburkholderia atlantica]MBB5429130.1 AAA+ superfamily predicted ATPase [Paraburkholderia atlantica]
MDTQHQALTAAMRCLDALLGVAIEHQARRLGPASLLDPWLGMHMEHADVQRLLAEQSPHALTADACAADLLGPSMREVPGLRHLSSVLALTDIDLAALLIVLAPDLDLRYERIYGYLQDDITRKRPSLDLIANLLATDQAQRLAVCARFEYAAPLRAHKLLSKGQEHPRSPLAQDWCVDPIWRAWLLQGSLADVLESDAMMREQRSTPNMLALEPATGAVLEQVCELAATVPLRLCLHGEHGAGKHEGARAVARRLKLELVPIDLRDVQSCTELAAKVERAARAACLLGGLLYVHGVGSLEQRDAQLLRTLTTALDAAPCHLVLSCVTPPPPVHASTQPLLRIELQFPAAASRHLLWQRALQHIGAELPDDDLATLAARFSLSGPQIFQAAAEAQMLARAQRSGALGYQDIAAVVRRQCGGELSRMATRVTPQADFSSLVAPVEVLTQLREICARVATRDTVAHAWAQDSVHARTTGVTALFVGPSGTGKTLSAEALARELGLDLYRIDLAGIVSKYIGETEKNLDRVFSAAVHANAVLFFDEADALFGKRSEVKDAHDRYANIEVAYLLQKMEQFDGLAILATNLKQNLDEAFARRLTFTVHFPFPEEAERRQLWESLWPPLAPRADDVDLTWFAREYRLSGGNIRNTVMAAAHLAAADGKIITRAHLLHATRREYQKLGKNLALPPEAADGTASSFADSAPRYGQNHYAAGGPKP